MRPRVTLWILNDCVFCPATSIWSRGSVWTSECQSFFPQFLVHHGRDNPQYELLVVEEPPETSENLTVFNSYYYTALLNAVERSVHLQGPSRTPVVNYIPIMTGAKHIMTAVKEKCFFFFAFDSRLSYHSASCPVIYQPQGIRLLSDVFHFGRVISGIMYVPGHYRK